MPGTPQPAEASIYGEGNVKGVPLLVSLMLMLAHDLPCMRKHSVTS